MRPATKAKMEADPAEPALTASPALLRGVELDAVAWAEECGLRGVTHGRAEIVAYPVRGHGFVVTVRGTSGGQERMATARFSESGERRYWQMDGVYGV